MALTLEQQQALAMASARARASEAETLGNASQIARGSNAAPDNLTNIRASAPMRVVQGLRDPIDAFAQMASHAAPDWLHDTLDYIPKKLRDSDSPLLATIGDHFSADPRPKAVDAAITDSEKQYQTAREATAPTTFESMVTGKKDPGTDWMRMGGNIVSPVNLAGGQFIGAAKTARTGAQVVKAAAPTVGSRAFTGATTGLVGGLEQPVIDGGDDFAATKATQGGVGAATGGVLGPVAGKVMDKITPKLSALWAKISPGAAEKLGARASLETDAAIEQALREIGAKADDLSQQELNAVRQQVLTSLRAGKQIDPAAVLRKRDFNAAGVDPTLGQITRDPTQFAAERNLSTAPGVGVPLVQRFGLQNQQLQQNVAGLRGDPSEPYQAGRRLIQALTGVDSGLKRGVDDAYDAARDHLGRAAPMDAYGFSQTANNALDEGMLGGSLPAEARQLLNDVSAGKIPFNVNTAVQLDSRLSGLQRDAGMHSQAALAIGKVRDALNSAQIGDNVGEDAKRMFDAARSSASQRFGMHRAIPALEAAVNGEAPDRFVQNFVVNGNVDEVQRLAQLLQRTDPAAFREARAQIGDRIARAAFGENTAGDKLAAPERLARALREIGTDKLSAFYSPAEIAQFRTNSRVAAYINSQPSAAPVQTSKNWGIIASLGSMIPGKGAALAIANSVANSVRNDSVVRNAVTAEIPQQAAKLTPEQTRRIAQALILGGVAAGQFGATPFR